MVLLQSIDNFDKLAELDTSTAQISYFSRREKPKAASHQIRGTFAELHGRTLFLYREAGLLHFRVDRDDFELTENTEVKWERLHDDLNRVSVIRDGISLFTWVYRRPIAYPPLEIDPTPFVEEDHFDFCLFVYNVVNDPVRRESIY